MQSGVTTDLMDEGKVMAAIDFGTSYSGIAYAVRKTYRQDRLNIIGANFDDPSITQTDKVPTAVLFSPDRKFHSFGQEAEDKFVRLCEQDEDEAKNWYFFHRFKMLLFNVKELSVKTEVNDYWERNTMPAIEVFSAAIGHLKDRLLGRLAKLSIGLSDIDWVLTIPAIWNDKARHFMRRAAVQAGIPDNKLMLVLEPEAATLYCRVKSEEDFKAGKPLVFDLRPVPENSNKKFLVLDSGGGTVDAIVYQINKDNMQLRELYHPSGGDWGGTKVDDAFLDLVYRILGFDKVTVVNTAELIITMRAFEQAKQDFSPGEPVFVQIPPSAKAFFENGDYSTCPGVMMMGDRLCIDSETFTGFFRDKVDAIVRHVQGVLSHPNVQGVHTLLMVGGFSSSWLLQEAVKQAFGQLTQVVIPDRAAPSILMGAVLFLLEPNVIGWRAAACTYGIKTSDVFISAFHDKRYAFNAEGVKKCGNLFRKFITVNDIVAVGSRTGVKTFQPLFKDQRQTNFLVFATPKEDVQYVTDPSCYKVGEVVVLHGDPIPDERERVIQIEMVVGGVELDVAAQDTQSGKTFQTKCLFLAN